MLLPDPLRPITPTTSPRRTSNDTLRTAQKSWLPWASGTDGERRRQKCAKASPSLWDRLPRWRSSLTMNRLPSPWIDMTTSDMLAARSDDVGENRFAAAEEAESADQHRYRDDRGYGH